MTLDQKALEAAVDALRDLEIKFNPPDGMSIRQATIAEAQRLVRASRPSAIVEPAGWKLVPVEPTEEMLSAVWSLRASNGGDGSRQCYASMLAAVPPSPQPHTGRAAITEAMTDAFMEELNRQGVAMDDFSPPIYPARLIRAALNAALTVEPEAGEVTVKPLEWSDWKDSIQGPTSRAKTAFGEYRVDDRGEANFRLYFGPEFLGPFGDSLDAKAAAQADYTARIRSAIAP